MESWQYLLIILCAIVAAVVFFTGYIQVTQKKNVFGVIPYLFPLGIFVWGDALVIGAFWIVISLISVITREWYLFLLSITLFWVVRSAGEVVYWLNEQFAQTHRNHPSTLWLHHIFRNDAVWFVYQVFWQCVLVLSLIASLWIAHSWLL